MNTGAAAFILLLLAIVLASLPFVTERLFLIWSRPKSVWLRLGELLVYYGIFLGLGLGLEQYIGRRHPQEWQFFAITALMFLVLAYPSYVWRYLKRRSSHGD